MTATSNGLSDIEANPSSHSINQGPLPPDESLNHPESTREKSPPSSPPQISDSFDGDLVSVNYLSPTQSKAGPLMLLKESILTLLLSSRFI